MASQAAAERLQVLAQQVAPAAASPHALQQQEQLRMSATSASLVPGQEPGAFTVALPEKLTPEGSWDVRRASGFAHKLVSSFPAPDDHVLTLYNNMETSIARYPHMPYLGTRKRDAKGKLGQYTWMTYAQAGDIRTSIGSGLLQLGIQSKSAVGIYSINCREWVLVDAALHSYNMISVPLYDTLGPDAVEYICNHAELAAVACSAQVLPVLLQCLAKCVTVRTLIVWGLTDGRVPEPPPNSNIRILSLDQVESLGRRHPRAHIAPRPADIATFCYTSGTTGVPKGAVLSHANLISSAAGTCAILTDWMPGERHISYLPLAHIYERVNLVMCTHLGSAVGFYSGNVQELLEDVAVLKPHIFVSVPRLWNRVYDRVMATIRTGSPLSRMLFERAYAYKKACLERGDAVGGRWGAFYDRLIFSKIKAKVGGDVKLMTTGASPISDEVMTFLRICFGAVVIEGYGMTETSCTISLTRPEDFSTGHVGAPIPSCEVKLVDIPEMNYMSSDKPFPRGEVCVRGPGVFLGYYKDEVQTRDCLDEDGWLHTGDVGSWIDGGRLKIIDRKKNIFKMAQGEYIAPEKIENVYSRSPLVAQCFVYGDSLKAQLVAVVVPDAEVLLPWAKERNMAGSLAQLIADPNVEAAIMKSMQEEGREAKLRGFEQVSAIHLVADPFTVENGLLTPTFKIKRNVVKDTYQAQLDAMYAKLPETAGA